jgi:hypothetical protein
VRSAAVKFTETDPGSPEVEELFSKLIPCDFIGFCQTLNPLGDHHGGKEVFANDRKIGHNSNAFLGGSRLWT